MPALCDFYPPLDPYHSFHIDVSDKHRIYIEECGNPDGKPVLFLHGGPGGGIMPRFRQFFDPLRWRIILFDQRGCGRSTPFAELEDNTTWDLVADIERIRHALQIDRWTIFGGSWGSSLALCYGIRFPESCVAFVLRGIFLLRPQEVQWFYQNGAHAIFPEAFALFRDFIPAAERDDLVGAYYKRLTGEDDLVRLEAARHWSIWEGSSNRLLPDTVVSQSYGADHFAEAFARIECHYFIHNGFLPTQNWILENISTIKHLPAYIVQGRYDIICPPTSAYTLHKAWPASKLYVIEKAGHSMFEPDIRSRLITIMDELADA